MSTCLLKSLLLNVNTKLHEVILSEHKLIVKYRVYFVTIPTMLIAFHSRSLSQISFCVIDQTLDSINKKPTRCLALNHL